MTDRVLNLVQKYATGDDNEWFLREAHRAGIRIIINLIPDLPTTTYEEAVELFASARRAVGDRSQASRYFPSKPRISSQIGRTPERFLGSRRWHRAATGQRPSRESPADRRRGHADEEVGKSIASSARFADRIDAQAHRQSRKVGPAATCRLQLASSDFDVIRIAIDSESSIGRHAHAGSPPIGFLRIMERAEALGPSFSREQLLDGVEQKVAFGHLMIGYGNDIFVPAPEAHSRSVHCAIRRDNVVPSGSRCERPCV